MIKYITTAEYYNIDTGLQLSKKIAKRDYKIVHKIKHTKKHDESKAKGYEHITIEIQYWNVCRYFKQYGLFDSGNT